MTFLWGFLAGIVLCVGVLMVAIHCLEREIDEEDKRGS